MTTSFANIATDKNKLSKLCKEFCRENVNIKLVFTSFKIKNYFSYKDPIPDDINSFLVYKFTCVSCSSSYIRETCRHFKTRIEEHIEKDNKSWGKPNLNAQQNHLALTLSLYLLSLLFFSVFVFFLRFSFICYFHDL